MKTQEQITDGISVHPGVCRMLLLSTAVMPQPGDRIVVVDEDASVPAWLQPIMAVAIEQDCRLIQFDATAPCAEGFKVWNTPTKVRRSDED